MKLLLEAAALEDASAQKRQPPRVPWFGGTSPLWEGRATACEVHPNDGGLGRAYPSARAWVSEGGQRHISCQLHPRDNEKWAFSIFGLLEIYAKSS